MIQLHRTEPKHAGPHQEEHTEFQMVPILRTYSGHCYMVHY